MGSRLGRVVSAAAALRRIDAVRPNPIAHVLTETVDDRMAARHVNALQQKGETIRARAARIATSAPHPAGCGCMRCDEREHPCLRDGCDRVLTGTIRLKSHVAMHKAADTRRAKQTPQGVAFLEKVLGLPRESALLDLRALRRFEETLFPVGPRRKRGRSNTRADKYAFEAAREHPTEVVELKAYARGATAATIYRLALLAGVSPRAVSSALFVYGLERLADEIRKAKAAPTPHIPVAPPSAALSGADGGVTVQKKAALFGSANENEGNIR